MSAIRRLLSIGTAAAILIAAAACGGDAVEFVEPDIMESDRMAVGALSSDRRDTDRSAQRSVQGPTAGSIAPNLVDNVLERQAVNSHTVGWLQVPGTNIDDVVLQNPKSKDNDYYLQLDFYRRPDKNGTFCADLRTKFGSGHRSELSRNTTLYGHSFSDDPDGRLFEQLKRYRDEDFAREHPYIFFSTADEDLVWEVFAVFDTHVDLPYITPDLPSGKFFDMLDLVGEASLYSYDVVVGPSDKILTLSTCTFSVAGHRSLPYGNDYRFAVMARLLDESDPVREQAQLVVNPDPLTPDELRDLVQGGAIRQYAYGSSTV